MTDDRSDETLMTAVGRGDLEAVTPLFERHAGRLFGYLRGQVGSPSAAEDLVQDTFLRLLRYRRSYRADKAFLPWLLGIARNAARVHLTSRSRMRSEPLGDLESEISAEEGQLERERAARLTRALRALPDRDREALLLSYFDGLKYREIAAIVGSSEGAIKVRIHRARKTLRARLGETERRP